MKATEKRKTEMVSEVLSETYLTNLPARVFPLASNNFLAK